MTRYLRLTRLPDGRTISPLTLLLSVALAVAPAALDAQSTFPPDSMIAALLEARIAAGTSQAMVIGIVEPDGSTRVIARGEAGPGRTLDRQSVFEIGSITKVFTGVLLADMARRGEVALADPVSRYLPDHVRVPSRNSRQISLADLSSQVSGLPRLPTNMAPANPQNPYVDYGAERLYAFLSEYTLPRDPGAQYEYSNLGVGLLGHVLARRAGTSYEALVRERILTPLGMQNTGIAMTPSLRARSVAGHSASGDTVPYWDFDALAGAGALRSSMDDMLTFAAAALHGSGGLHEAIRMAMVPRVQAGGPTWVGVGWHLRVTEGDTIVWHNGGTAGFRTFLGLTPATGRAVVLLTNTGGAGADDIGFHLLDPSLPLAEAGPVAIDVPEDVLSRYVGAYELSPQFVVEVTLVNGTLRAQPTAQPPVRLWPSSPTEFFIREVEARVSFEVAADGTATSLTLHQNGRSTKGRRIR